MKKKVTSYFFIRTSNLEPHISTKENSPDPGSIAIASPVSYQGGNIVTRPVGVGSTSFWWKCPKTTSVNPSRARLAPYDSMCAMGRVDLCLKLERARRFSTPSTKERAVRRGT